MTLLLIFMIALLLIADFAIAFTIGYCTQTFRIIKSLKEKGWKIEPPAGADGSERGVRI